MSTQAPPSRPARPTRPTRTVARPGAVAAAAAGILALTTACTSGPGADASAATGREAGPAKTVRVGYFGNITHAPALVGVSKGYLAKELGSTTLDTQIFNAGPAAIEALYAGAIDAAYIGPGPAINGFVKSRGEVLRIVSGSVSGGAGLVVRPEITSAAQLNGANLASPQLGATQDVALRSWLTANGLENSPRGGGDVTVTPTENAQTLELFRAGEIDGAWLPEPWASRLVIEAGAKVLVDEASLWPQGRFVTTHLIVATRFLQEHPETVEALIRANLASIDWINAHEAEAKSVINAEIEKATGQPLSDAVLGRAFANITPDSAPLAATLPTLFDRAVTAGVTSKADLAGIYDLRLLNKVLRERHLPVVSAAGLGEE